MALTNPARLITLQELSYFEGKLAVKYQGKVVAIDGITATTVEGALAELAASISALPSSIVPKGTKAFSQLAPATDLAEANVGSMWNISDGFTTTSDFVEGAGNVIPAGANVYVANPETGVYKYDVFAGMYDLSGFKTLQTAVADPSADGNAVSFIDSISQNENGVITVSKKAVTAASSAGAGLMSAADFDKLSALPDNTALTSLLAGKKDKQTAVSDPTAGSTPGLAFIATVSQDANGVITATKENVQGASASQAGVMSAAHFTKLESIAYAADTDIDEIFA